MEHPLPRGLAENLDEGQSALLVRFAELLRDEAIPAGALGPREGDRVWPRHVLDSLAMALPWDAPPSELLDVGSGAGLPGLPLAILWPGCRVTVLDKSGRRIRLLRRFVRILELENVVIAQADVFAVADHWAGMVFRGAVTAPEAVGVTSRLLEEGGTSVVALSTRGQRPDRSDDLVNLATALGLEAAVADTRKDVDAGGWLLIMRRRGGDDAH